MYSNLTRHALFDCLAFHKHISGLNLPVNQSASHKAGAHNLKLIGHTHSNYRHSGMRRETAVGGKQQQKNDPRFIKLTVSVLL